MQQYSEIGKWSEAKLDIVSKYGKAYSTILNKKPLSHAYIDAFAGAGSHISKATGSFVQGSPLNALAVSPPHRYNAHASSRSSVRR